MPPLRLTSLMQHALPTVSPASRAVISTLGCVNGKTSCAGEIATWVGLRNRFQLARALRRDGLPPLEQLAGWARVLYWVLTAEATGATLRQLAMGDDMDPAVAYRLVHRLTGLHWSEVRNNGLPGLMPRFHEHCKTAIASTHELAVMAEPPPAMIMPQTAMTDHHHSPFPFPPALHPRGILAERHLVGGSPFDVAITAAGMSLVTRSHAAALDVFRVDPLERIGSVPTGCAPTCITVGARGVHAYVTNQFSGEVGIININGMRQTGAIPVVGDPLGITRAPDGRVLYVTTNHDRLCAISVASAKVVASVPLPLTGVHITTDPFGRYVYVPCWLAGVVMEIDARTMRVLRHFDIGGIAQDVAISSDGRCLYIANQAGWLNVIHLGSGRVQMIPLDAAPISVSLSRDDAVLLVGLVFEGRVLMIDAHTLKTIGQIHTGGKPRRIAFDHTGRTALIANERGWIDVVR
jgi:DNA-binding beta-propeller fold protein YncE